MHSQPHATADESSDNTLAKPLSYNPLAASQATGIPLRTITAAIASGALVSYKVGRRRVILRVDLEAYLRSGRQEDAR